MHKDLLYGAMSILLCTSIFACSTRAVTKSDIDDYISQNDTLSGAGCKDIFVAERSAGPNKIIYVINRFGGDHSVYFATFDLTTHAVSDIHKVDSGASDPAGYIANEEIEKALNFVSSKKLYLFGIDSLQNIYVNPFFANQPPYLMRLSTSTGDSIIRKGYVYELYKGNWYLNTHR